ncbi:MAG: response regulator [Myxococcales bacterium]|nr:response regulator [Myxococcales bacterium]
MEPTESDLRRLFAHAPIGIYRSTIDGRFLYANDALAAMLGYANAAELLALRMQADLYVDPRQRGPLVERYLSAGRVDGVDVRWKTKSGEAIDVRVFGISVTDDEGLGFDGYAIDITAQRRAEEALRASRVEANRKDTVLDLLLSELPALIWVIDAELVITSASGRGVWELEANSRYGYRETGHSNPALAINASANSSGSLRAFVPGQLDGKHVGATSLFGDKAVEHHKAALAGAVVPFEIVHGDAIYAATLAPHRDDHGDIVGAIGTAVDVTSMRQLERKMEHAQRAESLGLLAGGVAHDFNNLLVAMLGNADLALRELPAEVAGRGAVANIQIAALRAADLTSQLLAFAGGGSGQRTSVEVTAVVEELAALLRGAMPPSIEISVRTEAGALPVLADASQLRQVVLNLVTNARDAMVDARTPGTIAITVRSVALSDAAHADDVISPIIGQYTCIEVADNGPGMSPAVKQRIFEPFFTTKSQGHGLGLAAMLGIVRDHGGGIRVRSAPGKGSQLAVFWPVAMPPTSAQTSRAATILIVDDDPMVADVLASMLHELGHRAVVINDGTAAIAYVANAANEFACIIVDLTMPGMSGRQVIDQARALRPKLPIIVCSGYDRDHGAPLEAYGYLRKPFRMAQLEAVLAPIVARLGLDAAE